MRQRKGKIVAAAGTATGGSSAGQGGTASGAERARAIEAAMCAAVEQAYDEGITDPAEILARKLAARAAVKAAA